MVNVKSTNNQGSVTGVLRRLTGYTTRQGVKMQRLDVLIPSVSPLDHPVTVSVHTERLRNGNDVDRETTLFYRALTFLKSGTGKGADQIFDQTRLEEVVQQ